MELHDEMRSMLYLAAFHFSSKHIEEYPYLAEALWAEKHGW